MWYDACLPVCQSRLWFPPNSQDEIQMAQHPTKDLSVFCFFLILNSFLHLFSYDLNTPLTLACSSSKSTSPFVAWCPWTPHYIFLECLVSNSFTWKHFSNPERFPSAAIAPSFTPYLGEMPLSLTSQQHTYIAFISLTKPDCMNYFMPWFPPLDFGKNISLISAPLVHIRPSGTSEMLIIGMHFKELSYDSVPVRIISCA